MNRIRIWPLIILIGLWALTAPTTKAQTQAAASASDSLRIAAADDVCDQRLAKTLDALDRAEKALGALQSETEARKRLEAVNVELLKAKDAVIAEQTKLIEILRKQSRRKVSLGFGLVKIYY